MPVVKMRFTFVKLDSKYMEKIAKQFSTHKNEVLAVFTPVGEIYACCKNDQE